MVKKLFVNLIMPLLKYLFVFGCEKTPLLSFYIFTILLFQIPRRLLARLPDGRWAASTQEDTLPRSLDRGGTQDVQVPGERG